MDLFLMRECSNSCHRPMYPPRSDFDIKNVVRQIWSQPFSAILGNAKIPQTTIQLHLLMSFAQLQSVICDISDMFRSLILRGKCGKLICLVMVLTTFVFQG